MTESNDRLDRMERTLEPEINARQFLDSKAIKALLGEGYMPDSIEIDAGD